jgi:hypothetical protein
MADSFGTLFEVPYFNSLTAGEFDASSSFQASDPVSHVIYSLQTLGLYQAPGQTVRPDVLTWGDVPTAGTREPDPPCGTFDIDCYLERFISSETVKDYSKRAALVLVAVVLIVVAIVSLR